MNINEEKNTLIYHIQTKYQAELPEGLEADIRGALENVALPKANNLRKDRDYWREKYLNLKENL